MACLFTPGYGPAPGPESAWNFAFAGEELILDAGHACPSAAALEALGPPVEALLFGHLDGAACRLALWPGDAPLPAGLVKVNDRRLWGVWGQERLAALARAKALAAWLQHHRFCGVCGHAMTRRQDEPARECPACSHRAYPRIAPVCIGLVVNGEQILLARSPHFPPGIYSALAGFVEAGESAEQCLAREIREEAGIEIANPRWFASQFWPHPHSLMLGFIADYAGGILRPQPEEIEDAAWFGKNTLPGLPHPSTLAARMIRHVLGQGLA